MAAVSIACAVFGSYGRVVPCAHSASVTGSDCWLCGDPDVYVKTYVDGVHCATSSTIESYNPNWGSSCCDTAVSATSEVKWELWEEDEPGSLGVQTGAYNLISKLGHHPWHQFRSFFV